MLQLKADNERMQRTIARNGLQDDTTDEFTQQSPDGDTSSLQKKLSLDDPTTFGLSILFASYTTEKTNWMN